MPRHLPYPQPLPARLSAALRSLSAMPIKAVPVEVPQGGGKWCHGCQSVKALDAFDRDRLGWLSLAVALLCFPAGAPKGNE